jgi:hypothetical protein
MRSTLFWVCAVAAVGAVCAFPRNGRDDKKVCTLVNKLKIINYIMYPFKYQ